MGIMKELAARAREAGYYLVPCELGRAMASDLRAVDSVRMRRVMPELAQAAVLDGSPFHASPWGLWDPAANVITPLWPLVAVLLPPRVGAGHLVHRTGVEDPWQLVAETIEAKDWPAGRELLVALAEQIELWP